MYWYDEKPAANSDMHIQSCHGSGIKVSICMAMVFLINTNGLLSKFLKFIIPWKVRLIISVCLVLIAISAAPRSSEYDQAGHINQIRADQKETEEMKKRVDYEI